MATDIYLAEGIIDFSGQLRTGIELSSILTLYSEKYIPLNIMETSREVYHLKYTIKQQDAFMAFSKRRLNSLDVFRQSVDKPHNTCTTQLVSSIVIESSYSRRNSEQNSEKKNYDLLVWRSILGLV